MKLSDYSIKHPAVITIILISIAVFGIIAFTNTNQEAFPGMGLAGASVLTVYPGIGAEYMEIEVTSPIEDALASVSGLKTLKSSSRDSVSIVSIEFRDGEDVFAKLPEIREKLNTVTDELPDDISGSPAIYVHDAGSLLPIYSFMVQSSLPGETFTEFIKEDFVSGITRIPGVSKVETNGGMENELEIKLHLDDLETRGLAVLDIYGMLQYQNISLPAGEISYAGKNINVRTSGEFTELSEIENLVIGQKDNSLIHLKDVADISFKQKQPETYIRYMGDNVIQIDVMKRKHGNTLEIISSINELMDATEKRFPGKFDFRVLMDQKETTQLTINTVIQTALTGIILAVFIIYIFLHNVRSTLIIGLSLPITILITFIGMYLTKTTVNMLSLSGITVAIGMIVDSSIVVLENTNRHFADGSSAVESASIGAGEVGGAVLASATTSICVFLPMAFLTGVIGIIMKGLSLTIVFALGSSALVSVIIVPYLSALFLKPDRHGIKWLEAFHDSIEKGIQAISRAYQRALSVLLKKPVFLIIGAVAVLILTVYLVTILGVSFLPPSDTGEMEINIRTPQSYSLEQTRDKADEIDRFIRKLVPEIETAVFIIESNSSANAMIRLSQAKDRERSIQEIIAMLQKELNNEITDVECFVVNGGFDALIGMATGGQGFKIRIFGNNLDEIMQNAARISDFLMDNPDVLRTNMSMRYGKEEIVSDLMLDYMGTLGITPYEAAVTSRIFFSGMDTGTFRYDEREYNIKLTSDIAGEPIDDNTINLINIKSASGKSVSLSSFTDFETKPAVSVIEKQDKNISVIITAYLNTMDQMPLTRRVQQYMEANPLPYGISWETGGTSSLISDSFTSLFMILGISVFLVYAVMVIQFEKFIQPFIIMISIPFCLIGVVTGLLAFGSIISIIPILGIISLSGIVVNNGIVMVDYINMIRKRDGKPLMEAVVSGCASRLKPILMTTLTTFFGVLPMAFSSGNGGEVYAPLGQAIAGGLLTSTLLALFLVPALYVIVETRGQRKQLEKAEQAV